MVTSINNLMKQISKLKIKDEIELINLISGDLYKKVNNFNEDEDNKYFLRLGETSLKKIWDNKEDDIYNELL